MFSSLASGLSMISEPVLVGDIGGTHSRWAIYAGGLTEVEVCRTASSGSLRDAVQPWAGRYRAAGVAVAGPVEDGRVLLTNADWRATESDLDVPVRLVNDLAAVALGVPLLEPEDFVWWGRRAASLERVLCIGVGTGFGGALHTPEGVVAMEPGHELLGDAFPGHTVESVVSGTALAVHRDDAALRTAFKLAVDRLVDRWAPDAVCLIGGVVENREELFAEYGHPSVAYGRIIHPHPALIGAARAAIAALRMTRDDPCITLECPSGVHRGLRAPLPRESDV